MVQGSWNPPLDAFATAEAGADYFTTKAHYRALAERVAGAIRGDRAFVLLTGDPAPNSHLFSLALGEAVAPRAVVNFDCGPELQLLSAAPAVPSPRPANGERDAANAWAPILVFDDADRLSDDQINEIYKASSVVNRMIAVAVLLARPDFRTRLDEPALQSLRDEFASFRLDELGRGEVDAFIRHQLPPDQRAEAFTADTIAAVADISGGEVAIINRLARRVLESVASGPVTALEPTPEGAEHAVPPGAVIVHNPAPDDIETIARAVPPADAEASEDRPRDVAFSAMAPAPRSLFGWAGAAFGALLLIMALFGLFTETRLAPNISGSAGTRIAASTPAPLPAPVAPAPAPPVVTTTPAAPPAPPQTSSLPQGATATAPPPLLVPGTPQLPAPPAAAPAVVQGVPVVVDTATLIIDGNTVHLSGVDGVRGEFVQGMVRYIAGRPVACQAVTPGQYRCRVGNYDLGEAVVLNGAGRAADNASDRLRSAETKARAAGRGIWQN